LASRKLSASSGSAGSPPRQTAAIASVAPNDSVISSQVQPGRREKRAAAPRNKAKKRRSGSPRFAAPLSPGIGNANEKVVKT